MWHEARKIEKRIRGIMIDYRRRAERRTAFYERMREDPHQLLQLHGKKCKLYIDSRLDKPMEESQLFDARSHLDYLPEKINTLPGDSADDDKEYDFNYERYRTLVQIEATGVTEEAYLKQLAIEEWYGKKQAEKHKAEKEALAKKKASIGYKYEGSAVLSEDSDKSEDESDISDIDISVNIHDLSEEQKTSMDSLATQFGIADQYYCRQLLKEKKEFDFAKQLEEEEEERSKLSGRRGKRARRTLREKQKATRTTSPPSPPRHGHTRSSSSRSPSPDNPGKIEYITEFGGASNSQAEKPKIASSRSV
eukprot:gene13317-4161_t